jgi:hypothetical protein
LPTQDRVAIAVHFTVEEFDYLSAMSAARGEGIVALIRSRVLAPWYAAADAEAAGKEDLASMVARLEGIRIRARGRC